MSRSNLNPNPKPKEMFNIMTQKYLDNILKKEDGVSELEVKFGTRGVKEITKDDFDNVVKKLLSAGFKIAKSQEYCLKIQSEFTDIGTGKTKLSNIRTEVYGLSNIQKYCRNDRLEDINYRFVQKMQAREGSEFIRPVNFDDFNFRLSYQKEKIVPITSSLGQSILSTWIKEKKVFRHINRTTLIHDDFPFHIDISVVKESHRRDGHLIPEYSFQASKTTECEPKYEIEIEMDNHLVGIGKKMNNAVVVADILRTGIKIVLSGLQGTNFPVSYDELAHTSRDYYYLLYPNEKPKHKSDRGDKGDKGSKGSASEVELVDPKNITLTPNHFIGPSSYTLQVLNVAPINDDCSIPNIRNNYTVTDKADGMRKMLYICPNGKVYLLNTNMNFEFTGAVCREERVHNTLIDGEHILHNKNGEYINLFAAFDLYFINGRDVRQKAFVITSSSSDKRASAAVDEMLGDVEEEFESESDIGEGSRARSSQKKSMELREKEMPRGSAKGNEDSRLFLLHQIIRDMNIQSVISGDNIPIKVAVKKFQVASPDKSIFACANFIISGQKAGTFEYETDGLIFTPCNTGVASNKVGIAGPLHRVTWDMSFKWKPLNQNTIDFLITTKKSKNGTDAVGNIFETGIDTMKSEQLQQYKTIILRVGYDERKHGYINPCAAVIDDKLPHAGDVDTGDGYKPVPFYPTNPYDPEASICNIPLREDQNGVLQMFTSQDEIFDDETIVEFSYDATRPKYWRWVAERVRYDKTAEYKRGIKNYGNAYHVANSNWYSIHNPVTLEMITTGQNIPDELADDDVYYNKTSGDNKTRSMRDFHNLFVKKMLITKTASKGNTLIDYAVGKAGDFPKWIDAKLSFVFGVDLSKDNIENRLDGACARFLNYRKKFYSMPYALFVNGNSGVNIKSGDAMFTEKGKEIVRALFNDGPKDVSILGAGVYRQYGKAVDGFNISSCQFALHYFFENIEKLNQFLKNVSECTKVDGYFIGSCYDGATMFQALRSVEKGKSIGLMMDDEKIWEVTKEYSQTTYDPDISCVGYAIDVYQDSINKTIKEYLVNFTYFTELMRGYGFELLKRDEAVKLGLPNSSGMFSELFAVMESEIQQDAKQKSRYGSAPMMTAKEKQISFYNRYFVFKKIASVDVEDVFGSVTGVRVFQEKMNRKDTLAAQMVASQMMMEEGDVGGPGLGASKGKMSYRPTKESELKLMVEKGEKGKSLGLSAAEVESADTKLSKLFGSKTKEKSSKDKDKDKDKSKSKSEGMGAEVVEKSAPLTLKKKSALSAVNIPIPTPSKSAEGAAAADKPEASPGAAASIIEKSKLGMKESSAKVSSEKAKSAKEEKAASAALAGSEADKPKEKKSSTSKIGSIKLNPSALASVLEGKK
jgi:hypothetical protein